MGSLLSYSGLTTKIRAMQSRLLTDDQYRELAELKSVPQAVTYLKQRSWTLSQKRLCTVERLNSFW